MGDGGAVILAWRHRRARSGAGGIEDFGPAADGKLLAVGEAGTQRWNRWSSSCPPVFEIDPAKLIA